ncbi:MAG: nucleoside-diphosphate sugar epimerase/dehydratase [Desulfosoma sp.]
MARPVRPFTLFSLRNPNFYVMVAADSACCAAALAGAYALRFEFQLEPHLSEMGRLLAWMIPLKLAFFMALGLYRGMWRFFSLLDLWRLGLAVAASFSMTSVVLVYTSRFQGLSRAVFVLDAVLTFVLCSGLRGFVRNWYASRSGSQVCVGLPVPVRRRPGNNGKCVLIIGAGQAGEKMLREILDNPSLNYHVAGFLDDDPGKHGRTLHGVPVLGPVDAVAEVAERFFVREIFIAMPSASGREMRRVVDLCKACGVPYRTLPAIGALMNGKVSVRNLRDVNYQDLLGRPPVSLDLEGIRRCVGGKCVLVTGAGGSIGSELIRQLVKFSPSLLVLVDAGEANLYEIQMELQHGVGFRSYRCFLTRVQNEPLMEKIFLTYEPAVVFHAAAYKHVPMLELNPWEAVFNNVLGSRVVMDLAARYGAERFVLVSTDKAVRPTNVMGASKRTAELLLRTYHERGGETRFMAVRFGNVIGSSGSVIPLFTKQIERGGPVTVTHPQVTRYFMTIPEAAQLILQAATLGRGGEIFVLEMGTPVRIADMARDLIRLCGKRPGEDVDIVFTGLREGEKLYEELITHDEGIEHTAHEKILVLRPNGNGSGAPGEDFPTRFSRELQDLVDAALAQDAAAVRRALKTLVPEYTPQDSPCVLPCTRPQP